MKTGIIHLELVDGGEYTCVEVRDRTITHVEDIAQKICDLRKIQGTLESMVARCDGDLVPERPIVDTLYSD